MPKEYNDLIVKHYFESLEMSRLAHEMLAVLGGKAPHNHGVFIGGITTQATTDKIIKIKSILSTISRFINEKMLPDAYRIAQYYPDYYHNGRGYGNFLSYGCFDNYKDLGTLYVNPLVLSNGNIQVFNPEGISEETEYAWYSDTKEAHGSMETMPEVNVEKSKAYSWIKAPRYNHLPYEVGPLARQWLSGGYRNGVSTMDRTIARVLEAKKITEVISILSENIIPNISVQSAYEIPERGEGAGLIDTTRGALGHWLKVDKGVISFYQIITPSGWNLSTRNNGVNGIAEQALIGTTIKDMNSPVELGRIVRSFDPCVSCATHVYSEGKLIKTIKVVP